MLFDAHWNHVQAYTTPRSIHACKKNFYFCIKVWHNITEQFLDSEIMWWLKYQLLKAFTDQLAPSSPLMLTCPHWRATTTTPCCSRIIPITIKWSAYLKQPWQLILNVTQCHSQESYFLDFESTRMYLQLCTQPLIVDVHLMLHNQFFVSRSLE